MENTNIFEYAAINKTRFPYHGCITAEDLYDLPVEQLDSIYKTLKGELKRTQEDSLLETKSTATQDIEIKIEIVKHVVAYKQAAQQSRTQAAERREQKKRIMEIMAQKQDAELLGKSKEELQQILADMK